MVVVVTHTIVDEDTMVIAFCDAMFTNMTMLGSGRFE